MFHGWRRWVGFSLLLASGVTAAVDLTPTERAWLEAALPVLQFARAQALPLDIVVQPQPTPGETPLGMAFLDGRCKLVLSMRGNPEAQATLDRIDRRLRGPVVEAIAAHELGHCWRHVQKVWGELPASVPESRALGRIPAHQAELLHDMWRTRREEGFADLVGLAWTLWHHAEDYAAVHAWYVKLRADPVLDTGPHDTRVWVELAGDPSRFATAASVFEQALPVWLLGLRAGP